MHEKIGAARKTGCADLILLQTANTVLPLITVCDIMVIVPDYGLQFCVCLSLFINDKLRICTVFLVSTNKQEIHACNQAEAPVSAELTLQPMDKIGGVIVQKLCSFAAGKPVFKIDGNTCPGIKAFNFRQARLVTALFLFLVQKQCLLSP